MNVRLLALVVGAVVLAAVVLVLGQDKTVSGEKPAQLETVVRGWKPFDPIVDSRWVDTYGAYDSKVDVELRVAVPRLLELNGKLLTYSAIPELRIKEANSLLDNPVDNPRWREATDLWNPIDLEGRRETMLKFARGILEDPDFSGFSEFQFEPSVWLGSIVDGDRAHVSLVGREVAHKNPNRIAPTDGWVTQGDEQWDVEILRVDGAWRLVSIAHYPMVPGSGR